MKAYKSLGAYNFFISGWVSDLLTKNAKDGRVIVYARVSPFIKIKICLKIKTVLSLLSETSVDVV